MIGAQHHHPGIACQSLCSRPGIFGKDHIQGAG